MTLLSAGGLAALGLLVPIVILHMLTPRRPPTLVSSLLHWDGLRHSITAAEPWQRLRWSLLLILQLLAVILFALALANPARIETAELADHTVFIIDASGSMAAVDGSPDRIADAVSRAAALRSDIPEGGAASVVVASANPTVLLSESSDTDEFLRVIQRISTNSGRADYEAAFALAESLVSSERPTGFVLISDGGLTEVDQRLAPLGTRFEPIGRTDTNRAITDLSVSAGPGGLQARVTIESTGGPDAFQTLRLDVDGVTVARRDLEIPAGEVVEEAFELPIGQEVAAYLDGDDLIAFDNQRFAAAPISGALKARVHGENSFFIEQLLSAIPQIDVDVAPGEEVDFEIYLGAAVPPDIDTPFIAVDVPGGVPGITSTGRTEDPIPTLVADDPLLKDVDVSRIAIADSQILQVDGGEVLLAAPGAPLLVRGSHEGNTFFYIAFTLEQSNLPVNVAFPIIGARMVGELSASDGTTASLTVGERVPAPADSISISDPRGVSQTVEEAQSPPIADIAGFWHVELPDDQVLTVAVNSDVFESQVKPVDSLAELRPFLEGEVNPDQVRTSVIARSLLPWILVTLLLVLTLELFVSSRVIGVPRKQWRWGLVVRSGIVGLILLTMFDPTFARSDDSVTTVFAIDSSDSLGDSYQEARAWADAAIADGGDNHWGVVEFGGDARVATPVGRNDYSGQTAVDPSATNLARALRLAESLLDGETKERIVLVSDGRANAGNLEDEIERLKTFGVVVEVHTIEGEAKTDAAIGSIGLPSFVNEGESFEANVEVLSSIAAEGELEVTADGEVIASETVALQPGVNTFAYSIEASTPGLQDIAARIRISGDAVDQNDSASTAVEVRGPASVLMVEGTEGEGEIIKEALEARGLVVVTSPVGELPGITALSVHRAVILANVSARDIKDEQVATLATYVRDLGRGLVVIGGDNSYALGGYQETELEALLPVDSEAQDAKREAPVAEVLLIDTSESMGACHCRESENGLEDEFIEGGVNKTDIAKTAAARAIDVLSATDEIGILAFSGSSKWVIPLQPIPPRDVIDEGISGLSPSGETRIVPALEAAAAGLRESDKELKHIILFTDGFTSELNIDGFTDSSVGGDRLFDEAAKLAAEGITLSVVATGEGAIPALQEIAAAGGGRFYPGRDLDEIPEIFVKEARLASRSFINEGEFFPSVTSTAAAVRDLASSPALLGYLAGTAKPTADIQLQVGEFADPLLSSWRVGLGSVTAWTSDGGEKWASRWATWDGYTDFWSNLVRDTFPLTGSEGQRVEAKISNETLQVTLEGSDPWPVGSSPVARVGYPDGTSEQVRLERRSDFEFEATLPARQGGVYAVGVSVENQGGEAVVFSAIASRSFAAEYLPGEADPDLMIGLSTATGGRGQITASQAFDGDALEPGSSDFSLRWWFLALAAFLWPVDVALRRLRLSLSEQQHQQRPSGALRPRPRPPAASQTR